LIVNNASNVCQTWNSIQYLLNVWIIYILILTIYICIGKYILLLIWSWRLLKTIVIIISISSSLLIALCFCFLICLSLIILIFINSICICSSSLLLWNNVYRLWLILLSLIHVIHDVLLVSKMTRIGWIQKLLIVQNFQVGSRSWRMIINLIFIYNYSLCILIISLIENNRIFWNDIVLFCHLRTLQSLSLVAESSLVLL